MSLALRWFDRVEPDDRGTPLRVRVLQMRYLSDRMGGPGHGPWRDVPVDAEPLPPKPAGDGWISVDDRMPPDGEFVLVKCPSGYNTTPFVYTTARRLQAYRGDRWIDHANDGLTDWGMEPTHWRALP